MFEQYKLPYGYDALEPAIDALTMETHYSKHHAAYTASLNTLAEKAGVEDKEITELLANLSQISDEALRNGIRNNGGGFYNHNLYFSIMAPNAGGEPTGVLKEKMDATFGSFEAFKEKITALATGQFGSGWAWMSVTPKGELVLSNSANQDNPISLGTGNTPIFGVDVWEHAYYLKYKNLRAAYIKEFFNVVDWNAVAKLYEAAL
ncbi:MAG: superoxide dismutase [Treponemataceae bacterium]|nr:superoxide dismutase [Treponemataceae bacterium]